MNIPRLLSSISNIDYKLYQKIKKRYEIETGMLVTGRVENLTDEDMLMAKLSRLAYGKIENLHISDDLQYVIEEDYMAAYNDRDSLSIIAFRGTNPSKIEDIVTNIHILYGNSSQCERFRKSESIYLSYKKKYREVAVTGHSLGGSQAIHVAKLFGCPCWAWNPGQGLSEEYLKDRKIYPNIRTYHVVGDPISEIAGLENPKNLLRFQGSSSKNPLVNHSMKNFLKV